MLQRTATTAKGKRVLSAKQPQTIESQSKLVLCTKTTTTTELQALFLKDIVALKNPNSVLFSKKNDFKNPFEEQMKLEFFAQKNNAAFVLTATNSKKRPNSVVFSRFFDDKTIDQLEFNLIEFIPIEAFEDVTKPGIGTRPIIIFQGDQFDLNEEMSKIKLFFLDFFKGEALTELNLKDGLSHVIAITLDDANIIHIRNYTIIQKKASDSSTIPRVELSEFGPAIKLTPKKLVFCPLDILKVATRVPKVLKNLTKKVKNVERDEMGDKVGRVHMEKQEFGKLQLRKMKGLRKRLGEELVDDNAEKHSGGEVSKPVEKRVVSKAKRAKK